MLAGAGAVAAKEGVSAHLAAPLRLDARPGTTIQVAWRMDTTDESGARVAFGAIDMFVRLLSATGGRSTVAFTSSDAGYNAAEVAVPKGGIGGIRLGLRGSAYAATSVRSKRRCALTCARTTGVISRRPLQRALQHVSRRL